MPAGIFRHLINFQKNAGTRDASGQAVDGWGDYHRKIPAGFAELGGGEAPRGMKIEAKTTSIFKIRYLRDVDEAMRIALHDGVTDDGKKRFRLFEVVSIADLDGDEKWLTIQAAETK